MKRFTETTKWRDPWFRRLSPLHKCLWWFILDECDPAGVIEFDPELATFCIGEKITFKDIDELGGKIEKIAAGKWLINRFVEFQYGQLSRDCKAHIPVLSAIQKHNLEERLSKAYPKAFQSLKEKDKDKEKDIEKGEVQKGGTKTVPRPTLAQARAVAGQVGVTEAEADAWWHAREATDWERPTASGGTIKVGANWQADLKTYTIRWSSGIATHTKKQRNHDDYQRTRSTNRRTDGLNKPGRYGGK